MGHRRSLEPGIHDVNRPRGYLFTWQCPCDRPQPTTRNAAFWRRHCSPLASQPHQPSCNIRQNINACDQY